MITRHEVEKPAAPLEIAAQIGYSGRLCVKMKMVFPLSAARR